MFKIEIIYTKFKQNKLNELKFVYIHIYIKSIKFEFKYIICFK